MTPVETQELKRALIATALYYGDTLPDEALKLYAADLADLPLQALLGALHQYRREPRNRRRPLPADLRSLIDPSASPEGRGREIAARLHGALVKYGLDWPAGYHAAGQKWWDGGGRRWQRWEDAAEAELGPGGKQVLDRLGGWQGYYQYANYSEPTTVAAQVRDLAAAVLRVQPQPPALAAAEKPIALVSSLSDRLGALAASPGAAQETGRE